MTTLAAQPTTATAAAEPPMMLERRHWLAALAILFVFFAPYQTLVQTVITDDAVRKGIEADEYDMTWVTVAYGVGVIYGLFTGLWLSAPDRQAVHARPGACWCSPPGNLLCGAATGLVGLVLARFVEGFGKMLAMAIGRATLYKQFDRAAAGGHRLLRRLRLRDAAHHSAASRRTSTCICPGGGCTGSTCRSALIAAVLVWRFIRPDRPPKPMHVPIDWLAVTAFVAWVVAVVFAFSWYRKWGGWTSNAFAATVVLCVALPVVLVVWLGSGFSPDEHLKRLLRTRVYVLSMMTRGLMLLHLVAVLTIVGMYCTELRGYPRITAGWLMVPTSLTMAATTFLTTWFHRRSLRHVWLVVGVVGSAACVWWLSSLDNFTPKEHVAGHAGLLGGVPRPDPAGVPDRRDRGAEPEGHALRRRPRRRRPGRADHHGADRDGDGDQGLVRPGAGRLPPQPQREPAGGRAGSARVADYFHQRGLSGAGLQQETSRVLGGFATVESVAHGFRSGLRFLSLMMLAIGLVVAILLAQAARGLGRRPGRATRDDPPDEL